MAEHPERLRVLIVDDEPLAREKIRTMLRRDAEVEVVGECSNGEEAVAAVREHKPDLLLLDVQMPELGGFEVLEALSTDAHVPVVIFVTAYDQYAVRAFEVHALDYLLKPFDRGRFEAALARAKSQLAGGGQGGAGGALDRRLAELLAHLRAEKNYAERLVVKDAGRVFFVETGEIDWIEAEGNYVRLHTAKKTHLMRETISGIEAQLDPRKFVRIHRSAVVQLSRIRELQPWSHGEYHVILRDGTRLTLSRNYRDNLRSVLGNSL